MPHAAQSHRTSPGHFAHSPAPALSQPVAVSPLSLAAISGVGAARTASSKRARPGKRRTGRVCVPRCQRTSARQAGPRPAGAPGTQKRPHKLSRVSPLGGQPLSPLGGQALSGHGHNAIPGLALQALLAAEPDSASPMDSWADPRAPRARRRQQASAKPQSLGRAHSPRRAVAEPNKVVKQPHKRELGAMAQAIPGLPVSPTRAARSLPIYTLRARSAPQELQFTGGRRPARRRAPQNAPKRQQRANATCRSAKRGAAAQHGASPSQAKHGWRAQQQL
jgi:hypothetical protein